MGSNSVTKQILKIFIRENFFKVVVKWTGDILRYFGGLKALENYVRLTLENGQKSLFYYVKWAKTSAQLSVMSPNSDLAEILNLSSYHIYKKALKVSRGHIEL